MFNIQPTSASFLFAESCNLNCSYCFEKTKKNVLMSEEVAEKSLKLLFDNAQHNIENGVSDKNDTSVHITGFGGEPLLNFNVLKSTLDKSIEYTKNFDIPFSCSIITNGTIMTKEISDYLKYFNEINGIGIQISVDGTKESHDFYRVYHDGRGSFDQIEKNLPLFKAIFGGEDYYKIKSQRPRLHLHGSLNKKTIKTMYESWEYFNKVWKIPRIWFMPIHAERWDNDDANIYEQQLSLIAEKIINFSIKENSSIYVQDYAPLDKCLRRLDQGMPKPCGAGDSYISFTAEGDIYPCHQFYYLEKNNSKIGNILDGIDDAKRMMYIKYDSSDMNCAKRGCKNTNCYRCIAENYTCNGSILQCEISPRCKMSSAERFILSNMRNILIEKNIIKENE